MTETQTTPAIKPAAPKQSDKAAFDAAMTANPEAVKLSPPERIWAEGKAYADGKAAQVKAREAQNVRGVDPETGATTTVPRGTQAAADVSQVEGNDSDEADEQFESAKAALRAQGFRQKHFAVMDREEILKRGSKAIKVREANEEAHRLAKEWRDAQKAPGTRETSASDSQPKPTPLAKPDLGKLRETLGIDEAGAKTLEETLEQYAKLAGEQARSTTAAELAEFKKALETKAHQETLHSYQSELGKSFPELLDPDTFSEVTKEAFAIGGSAKFAGITDPRARDLACLKVAAINLGYATDDSDSKSEERAIRRDSRSTVSERTREAPRTPQEKDRHRFNDIAAKHGL